MWTCDSRCSRGSRLEDRGYNTECPLEIFALCVQACAPVCHLTCQVWWKVMVYDGTCSSLINWLPVPLAVLFQKSLICRESLSPLSSPSLCSKAPLLSPLGFQGTLLFSFIADNKGSAGFFSGQPSRNSNRLAPPLMCGGWACLNCTSPLPLIRPLLCSATEVKQV